MRKPICVGNVTLRFPIRWFGPACIVWLGLLCASCQPVLRDEGLRPRVPAHDAEQPEQAQRPEPLSSIAQPPVPEISWSEPPQCQSQDQNQQTVCARLLYRIDRELREITWTDEGIQRETRSLADVPDGITSFSPDLTQLVIQTPRGHTAGGPLYLYDLETEQLRNLNDEIGLPTYTSVSALRVAGWHQGGQQLLLVNEDDEVAIWLDLEDGSYRGLNLGIDTGQMAPPRHFMVAADGSGFTFDASRRDASSRDSQISNLYWYDLASDETRLLLMLPVTQGRLAATAIAPNGEQLAYLVLRGGRAQGRSEEVHLMDLTAESVDTATADVINSRLLLAGNLGSTRPVWSPDGKQIALIRRDLSEPLRANPNQPPPLGDIWIISTRDGTGQGEATQLTFTEALEQPPVWSPDGRHLAFVTADGQIGMVATAAPGVVWKLDELSLRPQLTQIAFAPVAPLEQSK